MMLTEEEEARMKWCPFARYGVGGGGVNRDIQSNKCIGSACMAWRQGWKPNPDYKPASSTWPDERAPSEISQTVRDETRGYCGLAGAP